MEYTVQKANTYISSAKDAVDRTFRLEYHFMPPVGWMNDPNGLILFGGQYHLFYQFYPYDVKNGPMHWGHFVSDDLISYRDAEVALAPDAKGEDGCFSGGAEIVEGKLEFTYTRHTDGTEDVEQSQTVCLVKSETGESYTKLDKPVFDNEALPPELCRKDFRDPCPVKIGDRYYVFVGGKLAAENKGVIVVLSGGDLSELSYDFYIGPFDELGEMAECPSYCKVDGKDVIIVSGVHIMDRAHDFKNKWLSFFVVGKLDLAGKKFDVESIAEIDRGDTFYAPQFVRHAPRPTVIAWLENWGKRYPTRELKHGWVGAFSIPRELSVREDGRVCQNPVAALDKYRLPWEDNGTVPDSADITAKVNGGFTLTVSTPDGRVSVGNDDGRIYLDTVFSNNQNGRVRHSETEYPAADIRILLDRSSIELFIGGGADVLSSRIYLTGERKIALSGGISDLKVYRIGVRK